MATPRTGAMAVATPAAGGPLRGFALAAYGAFLATALHFAAFLLDLAPAKSVNRGPGLAGPAWLVDLSLVLLFCSHHSLFARPRVNRWLGARLPPRAERSVYVLVATALLLVLMAGWRPLPAALWQVDASAGRALLYGLHGLGWLIVVAATFQIDHGALFGLRQVFSRAAVVADTRLLTPWMYRCSRHPMMFGFLVALWATPALTVGHALLAAAMTLYIGVGTRFEERDLLRLFGTAYADYRARVPALLPWRGAAIPPSEHR